jgi:hypothetical protein
MPKHSDNNLTFSLNLKEKCNTFFYTAFMIILTF